MEPLGVGQETVTIPPQLLAAQKHLQLLHQAHEVAALQPAMDICFKQPNTLANLWNLVEVLQIPGYSTCLLRVCSGRNGVEMLILCSAGQKL